MDGRDWCDPVRTCEAGAIEKHSPCRDGENQQHLGDGFDLLRCYPQLCQSALVNKARSKIVSTGKVLKVTVVDGRLISAQETRNEELCCSMGELRWTDSMTVIPMPNYGMVRGKPWLFECNPRMDFVRNSIQFGGSGKTVVCQQETQKDQHISPASAVTEAQFLNI